jgi:ABC-type sugar transport system substrate-binding protein
MLLAFATACNNKTDAPSSGAPADNSPAASNSPAPATNSPAPATNSPATGANTPQPGVIPELPPEEERSTYPNANADGTINLDKIAHFDPNYDYSQNPRWKLSYISQASGPLNATAATAFEHWAPFFNMEWHGYIGCNGDSDMFMSQLQSLIDQGVKAIIVDPDNTIMQAVANLFSKYPDVAWMSRMSPSRDGMSGTPYIGGNLINNYVGFDNFDAGVQQVLKLVEWLNEEFPGAAKEDVGLITLALSTSPPLQERVIGAERTWLDWGGLPENFFIADTVSTGMNLQGGIDATGPIVSMNSHIKHWLIVGNTDDMAQGGSVILTQQGLIETSCIVTFGGSSLLTQWDGGQYDAFRYALFAGPLMYSEPLTGAVCAYLNGWTTKDEIWPSWVKWDDQGIDGHTYSQFRLPTTWIDKDNYKHFLGWTDVYANANQYPQYPKDNIGRDDFSAFVPVPANYAKP